MGSYLINLAALARDDRPLGARTGLQGGPHAQILPLPGEVLPGRHQGAATFLLTLPLHHCSSFLGGDKGVSVEPIIPLHGGNARLTFVPGGLKAALTPGPHPAAPGSYGTTGRGSDPSWPGRPQRPQALPEAGDKRPGLGSKGLSINSTASLQLREL